jgi:hypothetical protein
VIRRKPFQPIDENTLNIQSLKEASIFNPAKKPSNLAAYSVKQKEVLDHRDTHLNVALVIIRTQDIMLRRLQKENAFLRIFIQRHSQSKPISDTPKKRKTESPGPKGSNAATESMISLASGIPCIFSPERPLASNIVKLNSPPIEVSKANKLNIVGASGVTISPFNQPKIIQHEELCTPPREVKLAQRKPPKYPQSPIIASPSRSLGTDCSNSIPMLAETLDTISVRLKAVEESISKLNVVNDDIEHKDSKFKHEAPNENVIPDNFKGKDNENRKKGSKFNFNLSRAASINFNDTSLLEESSSNKACSLENDRETILSAAFDALYKGTNIKRGSKLSPLGDQNSNKIIKSCSENGPKVALSDLSLLQDKMSAWKKKYNSVNDSK